LSFARDEYTLATQALTDQPAIGEHFSMKTTPNSKSGDVLSRELAQLDAQMNTRESFAARVGLLPFVAGAAAAAAALAVMQLITHL
jgi:hypothetical protein